MIEVDIYRKEEQLLVFGFVLRY